MTVKNLVGHLALAIALGALGLSNGQGAPVKIGVLLKDKSATYWSYVEKGAIEAGQKLDAVVTVRQPPTVQNVSAQTLLLGAFERDGIDALVVAPINPENLREPIAALAAKGVKIVTIDARLGEGLGDAFVGNDQAAMSEAAVKYFASLLDPHAEAAVLRFNSVDRAVMERETRAIEFLRQLRPDIILHADVFGSVEKDAEVSQAKFLLEKYPQTKAVLASATVTTLATAEVLRERGLVSQIKLVGFGTYLPKEVAQAIDEGVISGWIAQQPKDIGRKAVEAAAALVQGGKVPETQYAEFTLVTKGNLHDPRMLTLAEP